MNKNYIAEESDKIIAIIPARGGSKFIPRKNIIDFCGKPLIAWSIEQALKSRYIKEVYVSTDDKEIAEISIKYGAKVIKRPASLSKDTSSSEEALLHAVSNIEKKTMVDTVVFLQATSPLREDGDLDNALKEFFRQKADSLFSVAKLDDFCIWKIDGKEFKSITYDYRNRRRRQDRQPYYLENGSIFIFKTKILKKYLNRIGGKVCIYLMDFWKSYQIDDYPDLEICDFFMRTKIINQKYEKIPLKEIRLIVYDFDGIMTNNKVMVMDDGKEGVFVNRVDGLAVDRIRKLGIKQIILTTEKNAVVEKRAEKLNIPIIKGAKNKFLKLQEYCKKYSINFPSVAYLGNDINDLEAMKKVGYPVCPFDAYQEIQRVSKIVLRVSGGEGVIKDLLNYLF